MQKDDIKAAAEQFAYKLKKKHRRVFKSRNQRF